MKSELHCFFLYMTKPLWHNMFVFLLHKHNVSVFQFLQNKFPHEPSSHNSVAHKNLHKSLISLWLTLSRSLRRAILLLTNSCARSSFSCSRRMFASCRRRFSRWIQGGRRKRKRREGTGERGRKDRLFRRKKTE